MEIRRKPPNPKVRVENLEYAIPHEDSEAKNILEEIVWYKDIEINNFKKSLSLSDLINQIDNLPSTKGFINGLIRSKNNPAVIAEVKKASPSKGVIREDFDPQKIVSIYERSGASCISVLTDKKFFQGGFEILKDVRAHTDLPLLCKDFIISPYQVYRARLFGADAILLIAAILNDSDLIYLKKIADQLNLDVLVEVHNHEEMDRVLSLNSFKLVGINNRDLRTFQTDLKVSFDLMNKYSDYTTDKKVIFISESGIKNPADLNNLKSHGIRGVLIGESFMKEKDIESAFKKLLNSV
tara:strand:- start:1336 stop:2223 length:888 start_codon:yes stop_codon:yes gene_type:complete